MLEEGRRANGNDAACKIVNIQYKLLGVKEIGINGCQILLYYGMMKILSVKIGLKLKRIVATTDYAPADRFFRIELSRVFEATIYGFSIPCFLPRTTSYVTSS